jgi:xanthine dehydrogenase accessory factor
MVGIYGLLDQLSNIEEPCVLATIIKVEGSSYRKAGTSMLFLSNGSQIGMLSSGCLEQDLAGHAELTLNSGTSRVVVYHMSSDDELTWGPSSGCNGIISILLESITPSYREQLLSLRFFLKSGIPVTMKKAVFPDISAVKTRFEPDGLPSYGDWLEDEMPEGMVNFQLPSGKTELRSVSLGKSQSEQIVFVQAFAPKPRLVIFGAGVDSRPVAALAASIGFSVVIADWRQAYCQKEYFPTADDLIIGFPKELLAELSLSEADYVLVMTHHFQKDQELLEGLLAIQLNYLGILGSETRATKLFAGKPIPEWVRTPVGLKLGAEGPEEIAVSIAAQLLEWKRMSGQKGLYLNEPKHRMPLFGGRQ